MEPYTNQTQPIPSAQSEQDEDLFSFSDFLSLCVRKWGWFLFSICVCLCLGTVYLLHTPKSYTRSASLIIKDNQSGGQSAVNEMMSSMGLFNSSPDVNNEMLAFQSPELFAATILRLGDNVTYTTRSFIRPVLLYGDSLPVTVDFIGMPDTRSAGLRVELLGKGQIELSRFTNPQGKKIKADPVIANLGDTVSTPVGPVAVNPGPAYNPEFDKPITVKHMSIAAAIKSFSNKVKISIVDENATVIEIAMTDVSIPRADDFVNTLIDEYNRKWVEDKNQLAAVTSKFINDRLAVIESELGNVDNDISEFKSEHLMPDLQAASEMYMRRADENTKQQLLLTTQLSIAEYLRDFATESAEKGGLIPANSGLESTSVEKQIADYNALHLERDGLLSNSSLSNPIIQDYDSRLRSMRTAIVSSLNNLTVSLRKQIDVLRKADRSTNEAIASSPGQAKYLLSVERQQKVKEALYLFLLEKREENELSRSFNTYNTRILYLATGDTTPTSPNTRNVIIICFLLGIILPAACIFISESLDTRLRTREDLRKMITPFLGEIPHYDIKKYFSLGERMRRLKARFTGHIYREYKVPPMVVKSHSLNIINEAFRMLRTNLEFITGGKTHRIIMLTSFNPGSGKSFITLNLAAAMALKHKGAKVLAIDLDLRRATLSETLHCDDKGVTNYLSGNENDINSIIRHTEYPGLDIIPVGSIPPNPTELLNSDRLKTMLDTLREEYEYIFIDCPPAEIVADAAIVSKLSDLTLFVIRAGLLDKQSLITIDEFYNTRRYNNLAVVLNGTYIQNSPYRRYGSYAAANEYFSEN